MSDFREDYSRLRRKAKERREGCRVAHYRDLEHGEFTGNYRAGRKMNVGCVKDVSSSLRLSTTDVSANGGYFIQHVAPYCLGIVSFRLVTDEDNYVHGDNGGKVGTGEEVQTRV